jgi:hypothetical protein
MYSHSERNNFTFFQRGNPGDQKTGGTQRQEPEALRDSNVSLVRTQRKYIGRNHAFLLSSYMTPPSLLKPQSNELTRGPPELVQHFRL